MIPSAGEALYLAGLAFAESLRFWRRVERLRPNAERRSLVTRGVHARLRHPIDASLVPWALAQPLLVERFGDAYRESLSRGRVLATRRARRARDGMR